MKYISFCHFNWSQVTAVWGWLEVSLRAENGRTLVLIEHKQTSGQIIKMEMELKAA